VKALTIRQPWAFAILHLEKDVENRVWRTHYRGPLLIHAAIHHEHQPRELLAKYMSRPPSQENLNELPRGCVVGTAELFDCVKNAKSRWADRGAWHWLLRNVRPIRPVECTGRLGLWTPSAATVRKLPDWVRKLDHR
jgi:hypothetical protein